MTLATLMSEARHELQRPDTYNRFLELNGDQLDNLYELYEQRGWLDDEDEDEFRRKIFDETAEEFLSELSSAQQDGDALVCWRALAVKDITAFIDATARGQFLPGRTGIGNSWAWDKSGADAYDAAGLANVMLEGRVQLGSLDVAETVQRGIDLSYGFGPMADRQAELYVRTGAELALVAITEIGKPERQLPAPVVITARRTKAPVEYVFHGTSSAHLPSILKHGLLANPDAAVYDAANPPPAGHRSLISYGGVYVARKPGRAMLAASSAVAKFGGTQILLVIQLQPRSALPDEDNYIDSLPTVLRSVERVFRQRAGYLWVNPIDIEPTIYLAMLVADGVVSVGDRDSGIVAAFHAAQQEFVSALRSTLPAASTRHPEFVQQARDVFAAQLRFGAASLLASKTRQYSLLDLGRTLFEGVDVAVVQSVVDAAVAQLPAVGAADAEFREALDVLMTSTRRSVLGGRDSLRLPFDIGFAGRNRIVAIVQLSRGRGYTTLYGTVPEAAATALNGRD